MAPLTEAKFWARVYVNPITGCWEWQKTTYDGYARWGTLRVHRWAYIHWRGAIPDGLSIDHLCRVRHCVNPSHMEPITRGANVQRGQHAGKERCKYGHPRTAENIRVTYKRDPNGKWYPHRTCRPCARQANQRITAMRREQRRGES